MRSWCRMILHHSSPFIACPYLFARPCFLTWSLNHFLHLHVACAFKSSHPFSRPYVPSNSHDSKNTIGLHNDLRHFGRKIVEIDGPTSRICQLEF